MISKNEKPLFIFDLDGTLCKIEHRLHFVKNGNSDWNSFYKSCHMDKINSNVAKIFHNLIKSGSEIWIFSGRSDMVRRETEQWLRENDLHINLNLTMRNNGDYTPDDELKKSWYLNMLDIDKERLVAVFDDRKRVVDMWRSLGVTCLQVNQGDF